MKKLKKILVFLVLVIGCVCCFCSCSCSSKKAPPDTPGSDDGSDGNLDTSVYYDVSVTINGGQLSGSYVSSTGGNKHKSGSSPIYTFIPSVGYAVETVTVDGVIEFTYLLGGYSESSLDVKLKNIDKNKQIVVTFKQMEYTIETAIEGSESGGTVVSSTGVDTHLGSTSPSYTVTPNDGYCIYSLVVDGEVIYDYATQYIEDREGATKEYVISEPFDVIHANHKIEVEFLKLVNFSDIEVEGQYYKNYAELNHTVVKDTDNKYIFAGIDVVTYEGLNDYSEMPVGSVQRFALSFSDLATIAFDNIQIEISIDGGESYLDPFGWNLYHSNYLYGITYNPTTKIVQFNEMPENLKIRLTGVPRRITITLYDYDNKKTVNTIDTYLFRSYQLIDNNYNWYYCVSESYHISNLYIDAKIDVITDAWGEEIKRIYLDDTMLRRDIYDTMINNIVLIYSSEDLKQQS